MNERKSALGAGSWASGQSREKRREGRGAEGEERKKERKGEEEDRFRKRKSTAAGGVGQRETEGERNNSSDNNNIEYYGVRGVSGIIIIQGAPGSETTGQAGGCITNSP
jgi:hypothetical protein